MRRTALAMLFAALAVAALPVAARPAAAQSAAGQTPPPAQQAPPRPAGSANPPAPGGPAAAVPAPTGGRVEIIEQVLVKVNGEIITKTELENRQVAALRQRAQQMSDDELKKAIAAITPDILVDAVDELLLLQRGKELGYKVTDEQFKRVLENIRKENKLESDEQFNAALKQEGISIEQLRKNLEKQMVINQVQQVEVAGKVGISDTEAQAYYAEHKNEFTTPASLTLRELLVAVKTDGADVSVAADDAAKAKAEGLLARAQGRRVVRDAGGRGLRRALQGQRRRWWARSPPRNSTPACASSSRASSRAPSPTCSAPAAATRCCSWTRQPRPS